MAGAQPYDDHRRNLRQTIARLRQRWAEIDGRLTDTTTPDAEREALEDEKRSIRDVIDDIKRDLDGFA